MSVGERIEVLSATVDDRTLLRSPEVGWFTCALSAGALVGEGAVVGVLSTLGRAHELVVPRGVAGRIVSPRPERVHRPVDWGATLYELAPLEPAVGAAEADDPGPAAGGGAVVRAPYSGRFWHGPAPGDPPFVSAGDTVVAGQTIGLIEIMKTFTHLTYTAEGGLRERARIVRVLVGDGAEVNEGDPLIEVEAG